MIRRVDGALVWSSSLIEGKKSKRRPRALVPPSLTLTQQLPYRLVLAQTSNLGLQTTSSLVFMALKKTRTSARQQNLKRYNATDGELDLSFPPLSLLPSPPQRNSQNTICPSFSTKTRPTLLLPVEVVSLILRQFGRPPSLPRVPPRLVRMP